MLVEFIRIGKKIRKDHSKTLKMVVGEYQFTNNLCYPAFMAAWLGIYVPTFFIIVQSSTTDPSGINVTSTSSTTIAPQATTSFNFLNILPQSAISIFSLGIFIGISVGIAMLAEKCYERLSIRDDSSDMSEHTKEILRARILGMVFGKKIQFSAMSDKQRQIELSKKYAHLWQYKAAMRRQRRIQQSKEKKRRSSVWGGFFGNKDDTKSNRPPSAKGNASRVLSKKPSVPSIIESPSKENSTVKDKRQVVEEDFVAIDIKPVPVATEQNKVNPVIGKINNNSKNTQGTIGNSNKSTSKANEFTINVDNNEQNDEFDFTEVAISAQTAKEINNAAKNKTPKDTSGNDAINREPSMHKYVRPPSSMGQGGNAASKGGAGAKSFSRPLTAGGSRPITAGAKRATAEYKAQGKSVRSDMIKKMGKM